MAAEIQSQPNLRLERVLNHLHVGELSTQLSQPTASMTKTDFLYTVDGIADEILTMEERQFYETNGFIVKSGILPPSDVKKYTDRFRDLCGDASLRPKNMTVMRDVSLDDKLKNSESNITKVQHFQDDKILKSYFYHPNMLHYVRAFGGEGLNAIHTMLINKPPDLGTGSSRHPPHQDLWYFPVRPANRIIACWTALQKITDKNGCLYVVPGSHRDPGQLHSHCYPPSKDGVVNKAYHQIRNIQLSELNPVPLHMEAGDTVFFHPLLYHGSGPNLSNQFRKAISCHYAGEDCHWIDIGNEDIQYPLAEEVENMSKQLLKRLFKGKGKKNATTLPFNTIWKYKSRHVAGPRGNFCRGVKGEETERLDFR